MLPKAIILTTYHAHESILDASIDALDQIWPEHPPVVVFSDKGDFTHPNKVIIQSKHWTEVLDRALKQCLDDGDVFTDDDYVLLLLEDHIPLRTLPLKDLNKALQFANQKDIQHLALFGHGKGDLVHKEDALQIYERSHDYKFHSELHPALWKARYLKNMAEHSLNNGRLSPWQFEQQQGLEKHYTTNQLWPSKLGGFLVGGNVDWKALKEMDTPPLRTLKKKLRNKAIKALPARLLKKIF